MMDKFPFIDGVRDFHLPCSLSLQQASSQATAEFKASLIDALLPQKSMFVDMTGGMGVDTIFISRNFDKAIYIERNSELCSLASENFKALGISNVEIVNKDSLQAINGIQQASLIYADPARRSAAGGKLVSIRDCEPDILPQLDAIMDKCEVFIIKLSPMLDISVALKELKCVSDIYVISLDGECKELLAICRSEASSPQIHCVNLPSDNEFIFTIDEERTASAPLSMPLKYIYEPDSSILKAGAFKTLCSRFQLMKLHASSHIYTSGKKIKGFPGRSFELTDTRKIHKEFFKDIQKANIAIRNFPGSVAILRKRLGIKDGGEVYMFATTLMDESKRMLLCKKI